MCHRSDPRQSFLSRNTDNPASASHKRRMNACISWMTSTCKYSVQLQLRCAAVRAKLFRTTWSRQNWQSTPEFVPIHNSRFFSHAAFWSVGQRHKLVKILPDDGICSIIRNFPLYHPFSLLKISIATAFYSSPRHLFFPHN